MSNSESHQKPKVEVKVLGLEQNTPRIDFKNKYHRRHEEPMKLQNKFHDDYIWK